MGTCCSAQPHEQCPGHQTNLGQHHSLLVHPGGTRGDTSTYNFVYRPPHLNQRLVPGEARPRFWLNPTVAAAQAPPIISVAWTSKQQHSLPPQELPESVRTPHLQLPAPHVHLSETEGQQLQQDGEGQSEQPEQAKPPPQKAVCGLRPGLRNRSIRWRIPFRSSEHRAEGGDRSRPRSTHGVIGAADRCLTIRAYPSFLLPYIDKVLRLRLVFTDPAIEKMVGEYSHLRHGTHDEQLADPMVETSHLVRNVHSLKVQFTHSLNLPGLPDITVIESHGGVKRLRRLRYRTMPVTWIDLDHRKPQVKAVGEQFELILSPPSASLTSEDFHDGNGERPALLGTYDRALDTSPDKRLLYSVRLYKWFNQAAPTECLSDISDICEHETHELQL